VPDPQGPVPDLLRADVGQQQQAADPEPLGQQLKGCATGPSVHRRGLTAGGSARRGRAARQSPSGSDLTNVRAHR